MELVAARCVRTVTGLGGVQFWISQPVLLAVGLAGAHQGELGDDANNPTYILNKPRVGYRMAKGDAPGSETGP